MLIYEKIVNPYVDYDVYPISQFDDVSPDSLAVFDCGDVDTQEFAEILVSLGGDSLSDWLGIGTPEEELGLVFKCGKEYYNSICIDDRSFDIVSQIHSSTVNLEMDTDSETGDVRVVVSEFTNIDPPEPLNFSKLFGTMSNVPSENDEALTYKDSNGQTLTPSLDYKYLDDGHGGIIMVDGDERVELQAFVGDTRVIPKQEETIKYSITVTSEGSGGTMTADKSMAEAGELVTLTLTLDAGGRVDSNTVSPDTLIIGDDGTFIMPAEDVSIHVVFSNSK